MWVAIQTKPIHAFIRSFLPGKMYEDLPRLAQGEDSQPIWRWQEGSANYGNVRVGFLLWMTMVYDGGEWVQ